MSIFQSLVSYKPRLRRSTMADTRQGRMRNVVLSQWHRVDTEKASGLTRLLQEHGTMRRLLSEPQGETEPSQMFLRNMDSGDVFVLRMRDDTGGQGGQRHYHGSVELARLVHPGLYGTAQAIADKVAVRFYTGARTRPFTFDGVYERVGGFTIEVPQF